MKLWIITRGEYDDRQNLNLFRGTKRQVEALVKKLNKRRVTKNPYEPGATVTDGDMFDGFDFQEITEATVADEIYINPKA